MDIMCTRKSNSNQDNSWYFFHWLKNFCTRILPEFVLKSFLSPLQLFTARYTISIPLNTHNGEHHHRREAPASADVLQPDHSSSSTRTSPFTEESRAHRGRQVCERRVSRLCWWPCVVPSWHGQSSSPGRHESQWLTLLMPELFLQAPWLLVKRYGRARNGRNWYKIVWLRKGLLA